MSDQPTHSSDPGMAHAHAVGGANLFNGLVFLIGVMIYGF